MSSLTFSVEKQVHCCVDSKLFDTASKSSLLFKWIPQNPKTLNNSIVQFNICKMADLFDLESFHKFLIQLMNVR